MKVVSIINLKGGVAKTISSVNIAHILSTVHGYKVLIIDNDKQGQEKLIAFAVSQLQSHDESGNSIWSNILLHRTRIKPNRPSLTADSMEKEYMMTLSRSQKRMWGETYTANTHGRTEDIGDVILSQDKLALGIWVGNNEYTTFHLPVDKLAVTSARAKVWDVATGAVRAGTWDVATNSAVYPSSVIVILFS